MLHDLKGSNKDESKEETTEVLKKSTKKKYTEDQ